MVQVRQPRLRRRRQGESVLAPPVAADAETEPSRKRAALAELDDSERANRDVVAEIHSLLTSSRADGIMEMAEQAGAKSGGFSVCEEQVDWCREALMDAFYDDRGALGPPGTAGTVR